jgi:hypothetical protein
MLLEAGLRREFDGRLSRRPGSANSPSARLESI